MDLFQHSKNSAHNNGDNDPVNKLAKERSVISQSMKAVNDVLKYVYVYLHCFILQFGDVLQYSSSVYVYIHIYYSVLYP